MPDACRDLAALGVNCEPDEGVRFRGIRFTNWTDSQQVSVTGNFAAEEGIGIRRTRLHALLTNRALEIGVRLRWKTHVALGSSVSLANEACRYRYLVGADGQSSRVRKWADLGRGRLTSKRFGFRRHYRIAPTSNYVEVHWCALGQVYITPVARNEICVAAVTRHSSLHVQEIIATIPRLQELLLSKEPSTLERGALTTTYRLRQVVKDNVALVGDASGSVDAVTGEGLALGFRQASLLSRSLQRGSLEYYAAEHEKTMQMPRRMAQALLLMDAHPFLRKSVMRVLASSPDLFRGLLQVHMGGESLPHYLLHNGSEIVRRIASSNICASDTESMST